jgi:hypothetical protein
MWFYFNLPFVTVLANLRCAQARTAPILRHGQILFILLFMGLSLSPGGVRAGGKKSEPPAPPPPLGVITVFKEFAMTLQEAREAASRFIGVHDVPPVITERKLTKDSQDTWFGFRFFVKEAEAFSTEWQQEDDRSWYRMVEVLWR